MKEKVKAPKTRSLYFLTQDYLDFVLLNDGLGVNTLGLIEEYLGNYLENQ